MKNSAKIFFLLLLFVSLIYVFNVLEFQPLNQGINPYFQSAIFSATLVISFFISKYRAKLFYAAFLLLFLMVGAYLAGQLAFSNTLASVGIGILMITLFSYLPEIVKKGHVEKL